MSSVTRTVKSSSDIKCVQLDFDMSNRKFMRIKGEFVVISSSALSNWNNNFEDVHLHFGRSVGDVCVVDTPPDQQLDMPEYCLMANDGMTPIAFFYSKSMAEHVCEYLNTRTN